MRDNEIIKALECCSTATCISNNCPYEKIHDIPTCTTKLTRDALDLINRLQAENERLKEHCSKCGEKTTKTILNLQELLGTAKAEAYKEFADRLKGHYDEYDDYDDIYAHHIRDDIDFTLEYMVGDKNEKDT